MVQREAITHVSDTALWMAHIRAAETSRTHPAFHDPLAALLAGERGPAIARAIPHARTTAFGVVVRTSAVDRLVQSCIDDQVDAIVNLGAGLDTRPYRMALPPALRWIEVDFPQLISAKQSALRDHESRCRLERISLDVADRAVRRPLLGTLEAAGGAVALLTEGLIPYLRNDEVAQLASEMHSVTSLRYWIQDFDNAGLRQPMPKGWRKALKAAPLRFQTADWFGFFLNFGWRPRRIITTADEAQLIGRPYPKTFPLGLLMSALPAPMRHRILSTTGAALMEKI
ncbi:MAG: SAM-dependent methyltransferase [Pseudomonadota bacterium]|nr:SAM-dependent methyltransferase [Pseudomonadota bacterium]